MAVAQKPPPDWELVYKRNPVERLKRDKAPLGIREELPALIAQGYENVAEEDIVRLQWWGPYHDKPKIGTFMLRVKVPAGQIEPAKLRAVGEVSNLYGKGDGELSTRQNIQLHYLELAKLPDVFAHLEAAGLTTAGGCGDTVRNITGCPLQGIAANELFGAITSVWSEDLKYRVSRVKARLKFMVDDIGPEGIRERVETKIGRKLEDYVLPAIDVEPSHHMGVHAQKQDGLSYIGVPVHLGLISGDQMIAIANLAERYGGDIRLTRQQNFIVTGIPTDEVPNAVAQLEEIGFSLDINPVRGNSIACTGEPHCNFSVAETKTRLDRLI